MSDLTGDSTIRRFEDSKMSHRVVLVGAGPGDPGLITVKGLAAVRAADCIVYDRLIAPELLREAKPGAELVYVGKENHRHTLPQDEINALLVERASRHRLVVRLKGGDPFVFGRGLEEMAYLRAHGIACAEIPGVTSAIAGPAAAGLPVTHRGVAQSFHVYTAHDRNDALADLDFAAMRDDRATYVFLMGLSKLGEIATRLVAAGKAPTTPVAVIANATRPTQRDVRGTLADIVGKVEAARLESPAVIVVGSVCGGALAPARRVLVPTLGDDSRLAALLRARGDDVTEVKVGEIVPVPVEIPDGCDWIAVASKHAVPSLVEARRSRRGDPTSPKPFPRIAAVGGKTAAALRTAGFAVDFVPSVATGAALHAELTARFPGARVFDFKGYENRPTSLAAPIDLGAFDAVYFTCASSVERTVGRSPRDRRPPSSPPVVYAIGPTTAAALRRAGFADVRVPEVSTVEALVALG